MNRLFSDLDLSTGESTTVSIDRSVTPGSYLIRATSSRIALLEDEDNDSVKERGKVSFTVDRQESFKKSNSLRQGISLNRLKENGKGSGSLRHVMRVNSMKSSSRRNLNFKMDSHDDASEHMRKTSMKVKCNVENIQPRSFKNATTRVFTASGEEQISSDAAMFVAERSSGNFSGTFRNISGKFGSGSGRFSRSRLKRQNSKNASRNSGGVVKSGSGFTSFRNSGKSGKFVSRLAQRGQIDISDVDY